MKINMLVQFMGLLDAMRTREEVISEFERLLQIYAIDYYGLIRQPKPHEDQMSLVLAGRWPRNWPETYIRKKYIVSDPTIRYLGHAQTGFRWRDTIAAFRVSPQRKRMERMMIDARNHGLRDGYIFPVHGRRGLLGNLSLGGRVVDLQPVEMGLFDGIAKKLFWKLLNLSQPDKAAEFTADATIPLTRREMEALSYLADGMTSNEIARVLSISNHTVDWYMNGIQEKLNARNRHHAVALSFRLGLIS